MENKKIKIFSGIAIIIILSITASIFISKYKKNKINISQSGSENQSNKELKNSNDTSINTNNNNLEQQHKKDDLGGGNSTIKDEECLTNDFSPVTFGFRRIIYTVKPGDNLWNILAYDLNQQELMRKLTPDDLSVVLDKVKDEMKNMTSEELINIGIQSGNAAELTPGNRVNLSPILLDVQKIFSETGINLLKFQTSSTFKKNSKYVCWSNVLVIGADTQSFVAFDNHYAADKNSIYSSWNKFEGTDPNTLIFFSGAFFKDDRSVFFSGNKIEGADVNSFDIISKSNSNGYRSPYAKDRNNVYFMRNKLVGANPEESQVIDDQQVYLRSGNSIYDSGILVIGADPETFISLEREAGNNAYSKDKNHVYFLGKIVQRADPNTFKVEEISLNQKYDAQDSNGKYLRGVAL